MKLLASALLLIALARAQVQVELNEHQIKACTVPGKHKIIKTAINSCHSYVDGVCYLTTNKRAILTTVFERGNLDDKAVEGLSVIPSVKIPYGDVVERKEPRSSYRVTCDSTLCTLTHDFMIEDVYPKIDVDIDYGLYKRMSPDKIMCFKQPIKIVA